jgi:hypothetical protein
MDQWIKAFLVSYAKSLGWRNRKSESIMRRLCEDYFYSSSPTKKDPFIFIAYGWFWGAFFMDDLEQYPNIAANAKAALLMIEMDKMYAIVAKENNW